MDTKRKTRVWSLLADEAGKQGRSVSVALVCQTAVKTLSVDGASVSVIVDADISDPVCATDDLGRRLEELQFTLGEGPCLRSFSDGAPVLVSDTATTARWSVFSSSAMEMGVCAMFAFPLQSGTTPIGTLELHRRTAGALPREQLSDALVMSDIMSVLLLDEYSPEVEDGASMNDALLSDHHIEVYQATGMVSVQLGLSLVDALARLRGHAFVHGKSVSSVAHEVVHGRLRLSQGVGSD